MAYGARPFGTRAYGDSALGGAVNTTPPATATRVYHLYDEAVIQVNPAARVFHLYDEAVVRAVPPVRTYHLYAEALWVSAAKADQMFANTDVPGRAPNRRSRRFEPARPDEEDDAILLLLSKHR